MRQQHIVMADAASGSGATQCSLVQGAQEAATGYDTVLCTVPGTLLPPIVADIMWGPAQMFRHGLITYQSNATIPLTQGEAGFSLLLNGLEVVTALDMEAIIPIGAPHSYYDGATYGGVWLDSISLVSRQGSPKHIPLSWSEADATNHTVQRAATIDITMPSSSSLFDLCGNSTKHEVVECDLSLEWEVSWGVDSDDSTPSLLAYTGLASISSHAHTCPPDCTRVDSGGTVMVVKQCQGYEFGAQCFDARTSQHCAFGAGEDCQPCPANAFCPGGYRAMPAEGYWTPDPALGAVYQCPSPSRLRCTGGTMSDDSSCGAGYDNSVPLCGACLPRYRSVDGGCEPCTSVAGSDASRSPYMAISMVAGCLMTIFLLLALFLGYSFRGSALPISAMFGFRVAAEVVVWLITTMQVFLQLTRVSSPGLPRSLRTLFSYFQALETDVSSLLPYECSDTSPFAYTYIAGGVAVAAALVSVVLNLCYCCRNASGCLGRAGTRWVAFGSSLLAVILYGSTLTKAIDALQCRTIMQPVVDQGVLTWEEATVWAHNTRVTCYVDSHFLVMFLALAVLAAVGLGVPLSLSAMARHHLVRSRNTGKASALTRQQPMEAGEEAIFTETPLVPQHGGGCRLCWRLPESLHRSLRMQRQLAIIYSYGQPWLRPFTLWMVLAVTLVTALVPAEEHRVLRGALLCSLMYAAAVFLCLPCVPTDHRFSKWKRVPRVLVYITSGSLALLQTMLTPLESTPSTLVLALSWLVFGLTLALPGVVIVSVVWWVLTLVSPGQACRCCLCGPHGRWRVGKSRAYRLLEFFSQESGEVATQQLLKAHGAGDVVAAMSGPNASEAISKLQASSSHAAPRRARQKSSVLSATVLNAVLSDSLFRRASLRGRLTTNPLARTGAIVSTNPLHALSMVHGAAPQTEQKVGKRRRRGSKLRRRSSISRPRRRNQVAMDIYGRLVRKATGSKVTQVLHSYVSDLARTRRKSRGARRKSFVPMNVPQQGEVSEEEGTCYDMNGYYDEDEEHEKQEAYAHDAYDG